MCLIKGDFPRKHLFTGACLLFFVSFLFAQEKIPQQVLDWQQAGEQCKRQNNYECACAAHQNIVDTCPQTEYAFLSLYHLALLHIKYGNNTLADEAIQNLLSNYAEYEELDTRIRRIAASYLDVNQPSRAKQLCQTRLLDCQNRTETVNLLQVLAMAQIQLREYLETEPIIHLIIDDYNDEMEAYKSIRKIATAYYDVNQLTKSKELYQLALAAWPKHPEEILTLSKLVMNFIRLRDYASAEDATVLLLSQYQGQMGNNSVQPKTAAHFIQKIAAYYLEYDRPAQAKWVYEWLLEQIPDQRSAWLTGKMVQVFIGMEDPNQAHTATEQLFSIYTEPVDEFLTAVIDLQDYCFKKKLYQKVLEFGDRVLALHTEHEKIAWIKIKNIDSILNMDGPENVKYAIGLFKDLSTTNSDPKVQIHCAEGIGKGYVRLDNDAGVHEQIDLLITQFLAEYPKEAASSALDIGKEYYWIAQQATMNNDKESAAAAYEKGIDVFADALPSLPDDDTRCSAFYMMGLDYWYLKQWQQAADAFMDAIDSNPRFEYAGATHWLISDCYENLKREGQIPGDEADPAIEWGYQTLFEQYPETHVVEYAAVRLGEINLARGRPATACMYFNWFLDRADVNDGRIGLVRRILEGKEVCR
jgi:tetratricopeptide (TPR) repeat protein